MNEDGKALPLQQCTEEEHELLALLSAGGNCDDSASPRIAPMSYAQERFWFLQQLEPDSNAYNAPLAFDLHGALDAACLERALNTLVRRHEALRACCSRADGELVQAIHPTVRVSLAQTNLEHVAAALRPAAADQALAALTREPLDLTRAPLLRASLLRLGPDEHLLLLLLHHFVVDGWAVRLLCTELGRLYAAGGDGQVAGLAPAASYARFAAAQRASRDEAPLQRQLDYWIERLDGSPARLELPVDRPRRSDQSYRGRILEFVIDADLTQALRAVARSEGVTLFMLLLAGFKTLLHAYSGQRDLVVGTAVSTRTRTGSESVIGTFWNTLPLRTSLCGAAAFRDLLCRVQRTTIDALAHQDVPIERIVDATGVVRQPGINPLIQAMFVVHDTSPARALRLPGMEVARHPVDVGWSMLDLSLTAAADGERLRFELEYRSELFNASTIDGVRRDLIAVLGSLARDPGQPLSNLTDVVRRGGPDSAEQRRRFLAFLIGEGPLLTECAQRLLDRGHGILGVASSSSVAVEWCRRNAIAHHCTAEVLQHTLAGRPFDLLLSVANTRILPAALLRLPRRLSANYHPAPLPRYAGAHPLSWALINGETRHAVTWHTMTGDIDAGDILVQEEFDIGDDRSTWLLAARCHERAVTGFGRLLDLLETDTLRPVPQRLEQRSYFSMRRRPPAACVLDPHGHGRDLQRLVNGLDHGPIPNPLGVPKIATAHGWHVVTNARFTPRRWRRRPGTVTGVEDDRLTIAVGGGTLELGGLATIDGRRLSAGEVTAMFQRGQRLRRLTPDQSATLTRLNHQAAAHEPLWRARLAELRPSHLALPPPVRADAGGGPPLMLSSPVSAGGQEDLAASCLAALACLLTRLTGDCEHDIGWFIPEAVAPAGECADLFETIVPLRLRAHSNERFSSAVAQAADSLEDVQRRGPYLRDLLVRHPSLRAFAGRPAHETLAVVAARGDGVSPPAAASALWITIDPACASVTWHVDPARIAPEHARELFAAYVGMLDRLSRRPGRAVAEVSLLEANQRRMSLQEWNDTAEAVTGDRLIHEHIIEQARRRPDHVAVVCNAQRLSYDELEQRSARLAAGLHAAGVCAGDRVAVYLERSIELVVAWLAILRSGAVAVALDPSHPKPRTALALDDSRPRAIVARGATAPCPVSGNLIVVDPRDYRATSPDSAPPQGATSVTALMPAYIVYTSGSTGRPKGVIVSHGALANRVPWESRVLAWSAADRVLHAMPPAADFALWEFLGPLACGATVVVSRTGVAEDPAALIATLQHERVTIAGFVPSLLSALLELGGLQRCDALHTVCVGGEVISPALAARFHGASTARLVNSYGPTEACIDVTAYVHHPGRDADRVPIGWPMRNTQLHVLDHWLDPLPPGALGEIYIGGHALAIGYLSNPALTAERFVPDPHSGVPGARLYRTGDIGYCRGDGARIVMGRNDEQVKIRGNRVELGEIAAVLNEHPCVRAAVVRLHGGSGDSGQILTAYVVPTQRGGEPMSPPLRRHAASRLPPYMCPDEFVMLESLPLMSNGKVDVARLPNPRRGAAANTGTPPRTALEQLVANAWNKVLGVDQVSIDDDFFTLGGHSLLALNLVAELGHTLGRQPPLRALFETPTVAGMAATVHHLSGGSDWSHLVPINTEGRRTPLFFVPGGRGGEAELMFLYARLARELGTDQPFYGLHVPTGGAHVDQGMTTEQIAAAFVAEMRTVQPSGPYLIGGDCIGGLLAYEVAQQQRQAGETVRLLVLFETMPPQLQSARALDRLYRRRALAREIRHAAHFVRRAAMHAQRMATMNPLDWPTYARRRVRHGKRVVEENRTGRAVLHQARRHQRMLYDYVPRPYEGRIALFIARPRSEHEACRDWRQLARGGLDIHCLTGDHRSYVRDDIAATAALLRSVLDDA